MTDADLRSEARRLVSLSALGREEEAVFMALRTIDDGDLAASELAALDRTFLDTMRDLL
jgi:hypothetical protein